ncbi:MAG: cytochrome c biogenesis protein CcdA [Lachnospiraceae bacterium]|nr:cytochrome c biogenesis protein CcdA [Lachnospiraceae bacterium]
MEFLITFLEGIISFISPCMLPMIPIYISYFAGEEAEGKRIGTFFRSLSFVAGFTVVFVALGIFAGSIGMALMRYQKIVNVVCGVLVIFFGLSYLEVFRLPFLKGMQGEHKVNSLLSAFVFGMVYSVSLTPCVGAFLGSALMLAGSTGGAVKGGLLLLVYSLGLGIPFLASALLIDSLKGAFTFIKKHYKVINVVCGLFLIAIGILMALGMMNRWMALLT